MRFFLCSFLLLMVFPVFSQGSTFVETAPKIKIDSLYREDQFYFGFTLNTLQNKPAGLHQDKFSSGFIFGFLRDFPVNKKRTVAIAPGLGFSVNNYNQNLAITKTDQTVEYVIIPDNINYDKNRFSQFLIEIPLEFRWRTSTYQSHKFWRVYGGFKLGYLLYDKSLYSDSEGKEVVSNNKDFNQFQYGAYISTGYNAINVYAYYGLKPLFESAKSATESIDMYTLNVGVMLYFL